MRYIIKYLALALSVTIIVFLATCLILSENQISDIIGLDITDIIIQRPDITYEFSLVKQFPLIAFALLIIAGMFFCVFIKTDCFINLVRKTISFLASYTKTTYQLVKKSNVKYLLIIPTIISIYMGYTFPIHVDEATTYLKFAVPSIWEAICLYPAPNNHIFYSVLANITSNIPWLDLNFCLRLPAIVATFLTWVIAYRFVRKYYSESVALFVVGVGSMLVTNIEFGYMARGYALIMLFAVICIHAAFNIINEGNRRRDWCIFAITSIFAAFTVPTFLYPFVTISTLILIGNFKNIKTQIYFSLLIVVGILLLYTPLLVVSGIDSLIGNKYVTSIDRMHVAKSMPGYIIGLFVYIFCSPRTVVLAVLALPIMYSCYKKDTKTLTLWAVFLIVPAICLIAHSVLPFFRVFFYYGFIIVFLFAISFRDLLDKSKGKYLLMILLIIQIPLAIHFNHQVRQLQRDTIFVQKLSDEMLENNKTYYIKRHLLTELFSLQLRFEIARKHYNTKVEVGTEANMDNMQKYDYCIILGLDDETQNRKKDKEVLGIAYHTMHIYKKGE